MKLVDLNTVIGEQEKHLLEQIAETYDRKSVDDLILHTIRLEEETYFRTAIGRLSWHMYIGDLTEIMMRQTPMTWNELLSYIRKSDWDELEFIRAYIDYCYGGDELIPPEVWIKITKEMNMWYQYCIDNKDMFIDDGRLVNLIRVDLETLISTYNGLARSKNVYVQAFAKMLRDEIDRREFKVQ